MRLGNIVRNTATAGQAEKQAKNQAKNIEGTAMTLSRRQFLKLASAAAAGLAGPRLARADAYPSRSVRVIVPFTPGGPTDLFARLITPKLSEQMGQQFYIENAA